MSTPHLGYAVAGDLKNELLAHFSRLGIDYIFINSEGEYKKPKKGEPRPILITESVAPKPFFRYRRCKKCKIHGVGLTDDGRIRLSRFCEFCFVPELKTEDIWYSIESTTSFQHLGLPEWIKTLEVNTVKDVRELLKSSKLQNVGEKRKEVVQEALNNFRTKVTQLLM